MSLSTEVDLVIVGGGIAGLVAANRARDLALKVTVLEAETDEKYQCATRLSGGVFHTIFNSVRTPPEKLYEAIITGTGGMTDPALARALAKHSARVVDWLIAGGADFSRIEPDKEGWLDTVAAPLGYQNQTKLLWEGLGADTLMRHLEKRFLEKGGSIMRGQRAKRLLTAGDSCTGVVALSESEAQEQLFYGATLLADGSFHGNEQLVRKYLTPNPQNLAYRGPVSGQGDGLLMAKALRADLAGMDWFYGHLLSADALHQEDLRLFPFLDFLASAGILVDDTGRRFADEGKGGCYMANIMAKNGTGLGTVIFDQAIWNNEGKHFFSPPNPRLIDNAGTLHKAHDLATLADMSGLPEQALLETVTRYNDAVRTGTLEKLPTPRSSAAHKAKPIITPPFYATPSCAAISHAFGGLRIDEQARVLREGNPIPGLYAAGAICGGIDGGPEASYVGGLIIGAVFGLLAAESVAGKAASVL